MPGLIHDSEEHAAIRATVAAIANRYGPQYFLERARSGGDIDELWKELGAAGLLGVHLPEDYGGGGVAEWPRRSSWSRNSPRTACRC